MAEKSKETSVVIDLLIEQKKEAEKKLIEAERNIQKWKSEARSLREGIKEIDRTVAFINKGQSKDSLQKEIQSAGVKQPVVSDKILNLSPEEIGLATRTVNALGWHDIVSVRQLIEIRSRDLLKIKGVGRKAVAQIEKALEKLNLSLSKD